jgi:hypothetical protein
MADLSNPDWRRSSHCAADSCVEVSLAGDRVALRDSKDRNGPVLEFDESEWTEFLAGAHNGDFDLPSGW